MSCSCNHHSMTPRKERLTVTVDRAVLDAGNETVAAGRADSLSAWVSRAVAERVAKEADSVRTGQRLIAAIAETPCGTRFIQMFGLDARVAAEHDSFLRFAKGLR